MIADHMAAAIARGANVGEDKPQRIVTSPTEPEPLECIDCGIPVRPHNLGELFGLHGKWAIVSICYDGVRDEHGEPVGHLDCLEKRTRADLSEFLAKDRYKGARMSGSGLTAAELAYPMSWMRDRMRGIPFPGEPIEDPATTPIWRYVWGRSGTGVSAQLALAVRHYVEMGKRCLMVAEPSMLQSLMPDGGKTVADFLKWDVLAIDKFGGWRSAYTTECIEAIVSERARWKRPTLFGSLYQIDRPSTDAERYPCIENMPSGGSIAGKIAIATCGWRGICEMTTDRRPMPDMREPTTYQQRTGAEKARAATNRGRMQTMRRSESPSPI